MDWLHECASQSHALAGGAEPLLADLFSARAWNARRGVRYGCAARIPGPPCRAQVILRQPSLAFIPCQPVGAV